MKHIRVASAQYDIGFFHHWSDYQSKLEGWVSHAVAGGAQLLVFPEYGSMELASVFGPDVYRDMTQQFIHLQTLWADVQALHLSLAREHGIMLLGASFPRQLDDGSYRNRAVLYGPDGVLGYQDKLIMTRFENEHWQIRASDRIGVIATDIGPVGINICYDSEFPLLARHQVEAGANLILVPSCTDTEAGFYRVRIGSQARALENQCYVIQSPTIGQAEWSEAVDINTGRASIYAPVDYGFPADGILAESSGDKPGWVFADLDLAAIAEVRKNGQVFNYRDWPQQYNKK
ncbi:MAG: carbon-nitrogen hydrolase family protein [Pseudomonadota bacterium]|nr:carbon-nitrogen hydrolase family protein [Pseudomonadota bacterium]